MSKGLGSRNSLKGERNYGTAVPQWDTRREEGKRQEWRNIPWFLCYPSNSLNSEGIILCNTCIIPLNYWTTYIYIAIYLWDFLLLIYEISSFPAWGRSLEGGNGKSHGQRSLVGYSTRGRKVSNMTQWLSTHAPLLRLWVYHYYYFWFL